MPGADQLMTNDFLTSLRTNTAYQHRQLESTQLSKRLLDETVTLSDYSNYLQKMKEVIRFCEEQVFHLVHDVVPDVENRRKLYLIRQDLKYLHLPETPQLAFDPPLFIPSPAYALGHLYVVEGSTLGGRVILKHLKNRLPVTEEQGGKFFACYGNATGSLWRDFLQKISSYAAGNSCENEIIKGAQETFEAIFQYFLNHED